MVEAALVMLMRTDHDAGLVTFTKKANMPIIFRLFLSECILLLLSCFP